jgi:hybrid cluster-associated redox disulfide protein
MGDKITKDTLIAELAQKYPATVQVFQAYGLGCFGCVAAAFETVEDISHHGIDMDQFLKDLNKAAGLE